MFIKLIVATFFKFLNMFFAGNLERRITALSTECQTVREEKIEQQQIFDEKMDNIRSLLKSQSDTISVDHCKIDILREEKEYLIISTHVAVDKARSQLRQERRHTANLMFVIHSQVICSSLGFFSCFY